MPETEQVSEADTLASDVGGTFTDFVYRTPSGELDIQKRPSDRSHPSGPVRTQLDDLEPAAHLHGTTVATNAVLERSGADVAFITTEGFRDLLHIGRQERPDLYDARVVKPEPLIPRQYCFEVAERIAPDGTVLDPLDELDARSVRDRVRAIDPDAVAICLLHAYANDRHERMLAEQFDSLPVSRSSEVLPEFREYERASSTVLNAYLAPGVDAYVNELRPTTPTLSLMKSSGGLGPAEQVLKRPLDLLLSGPAGGAVAGQRLGQRVDASNLVNVDIGGTSADISLVVDGEPVRASRSKIEGVPVGIPMIDVETIGAGGGSIATFDEGGALQVGPESAGANPGPICYDRGGTKLTVTDAHFALGHIGTSTRLAEQLSLVGEPVRTAFKEQSKATSITPHRIANGILDVVNSRMNRAIRSIFARRGEDPESFAMVAFGGAGPLHACDLAESLGMSTIYIPPVPGVFSACGILQARESAVRSRTVLQPFTGVTKRIDDELENLRRAVRTELRSTRDRSPKEVTEQTELDLRYRGQSYEIPVPRSGASPETFHQLHRKHYGYEMPDEEIELVNLRVRAWSPGTSRSVCLSPGDEEGAPRETRSPLLHDPFNQFPVYRRSDLGTNQELDQPCIVEEPSSTIRVKSGWRLRVLDDGTLRLRHLL